MESGKLKLIIIGLGYEGLLFKSDQSDQRL